jgi:hypothetical protein
MNGQPPPPPPAPYYPPPRSGMGCFAKGCLSVLIVGFLLTAVIVGSGWYFYKKISNLTSAGPVDIQVETPTPAQIQAAEGSRDKLNEAIARNQETTVEFTGPELSLLLSRDSDFSFLRDRCRIDISNSIMTVAMSAPLNTFPWPGMKGRWFNGTLRFSMAYDSGTFRVDIKSAEANGHEFPSAFFSSFNSSFNDSMNKGFQDELRKNNRGSEFWSHIKSMSLQGDKVVVITKAE